MSHSHPNVRTAPRGMIVIELLVVLFILVGVGAMMGHGLGFLMPGNAQRMKSNVNVRSVGIGMIMYASGINDKMPESAADNNGAAGRESVALKKMIDQGCFDSVTLDNPRDRGSELGWGVNEVDALQAGTDYWLLATDNNAYTNHNLSTVPLVGDKNTGTADDTASIWSPRGPWSGGVFWADGHVTSEESPLVDTKWPNTVKPNLEDHLFQGDKTDAIFEMD